MSHDLGKCYYCGEPATRGYRELSHTLTCGWCMMIPEMASVDYARSSIRSCTNTTSLARALEWEREHGRRSTMITMLEQRIKALGKTTGGDES